MRWGNDPAPETTTPEVLEDYLLFPRGRIQRTEKELGIPQRYPRSFPPNKGEILGPVFHEGEKTDCVLLYDASWDEERKATAAEYINTWRNVWNGCTGYHCSGSWIRDDDRPDTDYASGEDGGRATTAPPRTGHYFMDSGSLAVPAVTHNTDNTDKPKENTKRTKKSRKRKRKRNRKKRTGRKEK